MALGRLGHGRAVERVSSPLSLSAASDLTAPLCAPRAREHEDSLTLMSPKPDGPLKAASMLGLGPTPACPRAQSV